MALFSFEGNSKQIAQTASVSERNEILFKSLSSILTSSLENDSLYLVDT